MARTPGGRAHISLRPTRSCDIRSLAQVAVADRLGDLEQGRACGELRVDVPWVVHETWVTPVGGEEEKQHVTATPGKLPVGEFTSTAARRTNVAVRRRFPDDARAVRTTLASTLTPGKPETHFLLPHRRKVLVAKQKNVARFVCDQQSFRHKAHRLHLRIDVAGVPRSDLTGGRHLAADVEEVRAE